MPSKWARVDFERCAPRQCDGAGGVCTAVGACTHRVLEQEDPFESPMLLSATMCVGCGDCVTACPFGAIVIERG